MILLLLSFIIFIAILAYRSVKKRQNYASRIFEQMNCSGVPNEPALTDEEKHNILRQDFHPSVAESHWDVIIVGSGISGLTTAKLLAAAGKKVLVLEQHDRAGGACHTFDLDKYEFDVGVHYVTEMHPGTDIYNICAAVSESQVQWRQLEDPFDTVIVNNKKYGRITGSSESFRKQLHEWFPDEVKKIDAYFEYMNTCLKEAPWMFRAKFMPLPLVRFLFKTNLFSIFSDLFKHMKRTLIEVMEEYKFSNELQIVMSYYFVNYGVPPNRASFVQHSLFMMNNGFYPVGGATSITTNIIRSIEKLGGKVLVKADVKRISFESGKVNGVFVDRGRQDCFVAAPTVISTIPLTRAFEELIPKEISSQSAISKAVEKVNQLDVVRLGGFQAYIGLNGSQADLNLPSGNFLWFKTANLLDVDNYLNLSLEDAIEYGCPPFVFICFPSAKNPLWDEKHPGVSTCQLISLASPKWFEEFKDKSKKKSQKRVSKEDYLRLKQTIGETMIDCLLKLFPDVSNKIAYTEYSSPLTQQYFMQNNYGELYSLSQQVERFGPEIWSELRCKTNIPGLYFSGQDVLFCGVSSAFKNGLLTASVVLGTDLQSSLNETVKEQRSFEEAKND